MTRTVSLLVPRVACWGLIACLPSTCGAQWLQGPYGPIWQGPVVVHNPPGVSYSPPVFVDRAPAISYSPPVVVHRGPAIPYSPPVVVHHPPSISTSSPVVASSAPVIPWSHTQPPSSVTRSSPDPYQQRRIESRYYNHDAESAELTMSDLITIKARLGLELTWKEKMIASQKHLELMKPNGQVFTYKDYLDYYGSSQFREETSAKRGEDLTTPTISSTNPSR